MNKNLAILASSASIAISLTLIFGYWVPNIQRSQSAYDEAQHDLEIANENLAQAYANMPWTLEEIFADVDHEVAIDTFDASTAMWLKTRITELRNESCARTEPPPN